MFLRESEKLTPDDIRALEAKLGFTIPIEVKEHYLRHNGGIPDPNCWMMENGEWHCIQQFIPMKYGRRTLDSVYLQGIEKGYLTKNLVPFANDHGGNYFCCDEAGRVYFCAMDVWSRGLPDEANRKRATKLLAASFSAFVSGLVPDPEKEEDDEDDD